jgi:Fe2+ or Zn2+ uptake regulation protein
MPTEFSGIASDTFARAQELMQRNKVRLTFTRIATMAVLLQEDEPLGVDAIYNRLADTGQAISRASVYRALAEFQRCGLALQGWEDIESGRMVYARAPERLPLTVYQLSCFSCGRVMQIEDKLFAQQLYHHARRAGFDRSLNDIRISVVCNDCEAPGSHR